MGHEAECSTHIRAQKLGFRIAGVSMKVAAELWRCSHDLTLGSAQIAVGGSRLGQVVAGCGGRRDLSASLELREAIRHEVEGHTDLTPRAPIFRQQRVRHLWPRRRAPDTREAQLKRDIDALVQRFAKQRQGIEKLRLRQSARVWSCLGRCSADGCEKDGYI
jgi:hypothetical protein